MKFSQLIALDQSQKRGYPSVGPHGDDPELRGGRLTGSLSPEFASFGFKPEGNVSTDGGVEGGGRGEAAARREPPVTRWCKRQRSVIHGVGADESFSERTGRVAAHAWRTRSRRRR